MSCYLLIGEAPNETIASQVAIRYKDCPYVHFIAPFNRMLVAVYYLPEEQRWWLELVTAQPQLTLGLSRAALYRSKSPAFPESFELRATPTGNLAPCGSDCPQCERFASCRRCPDTTHWSEGSSSSTG